MTAPEPPEVEADELAAAVAGMRSLVRTGAIPAITDDLRLILAEYDRRGRSIGHQGEALRYEIKRRMGAEADLARALPVVEAAGAMARLYEAEVPMGSDTFKYHLRVLVLAVRS